MLEGTKAAMERAKFWKPKGEDTEDRKFGEPVKSVAQRIEKYLILMGWFFGGIGLFYVCLNIMGGFYALVIVITITGISLFLYYIFIKIPSRLIMSVELSEDRDIDYVDFIDIPNHIWHEWDRVGSPPQFHNKADGSEIFIADYIDTRDKVIYSSFAIEDTNLFYVLDKASYVRLKNKYLQMVDRYHRLEMTVDLTVMFKFGLLVEKLDKVLWNSPDMLLHYRDFGQETFTTETGTGAGTKPFSMYGSLEEMEERIKKTKEDNKRLEADNKAKDKKEETHKV
jgi:uncharacterized small protein (DUF1192 family)